MYFLAFCENALDSCGDNTGNRDLFGHLNALPIQKLDKAPHIRATKILIFEGAFDVVCSVVARVYLSAKNFRVMGDVVSVSHLFGNRYLLTGSTRILNILHGKYETDIIGSLSTAASELDQISFADAWPCGKIEQDSTRVAVGVNPCYQSYRIPELHSSRKGGSSQGSRGIRPSTSVDRLSCARHDPACTQAATSRASDVRR